MLWRANDVLVGAITGVISAVVAAVFEGSVMTIRFWSLGHAGGSVGSKLPFIAILGAIIGGLVGLFLGVIFKPRRPPPPRQPVR